MVAKSNLVHKKIMFTMGAEWKNFPSWTLTSSITIGFYSSTYIYRGPAYIRKIIPRDPDHSFPHKVAAYDSIIRRILPPSPNKQQCDKELDYILETALINGFKLNQFSKRERST